MRNPDSKVKAAEGVTRRLSERFPALPDDTAALVRLNGGIQIGAAVLMALGKLRRLSALVLIGSIIPTTLAAHRFWDELDDAKRAAQQMQFFKNMGILGGLILAATDTEGAPSVSWRIKRRVGREGGGRSSHLGSHTAGQYLQSGADMASELLSLVEDRFASD